MSNRNNREAQEDELTVLESIYEKNILHINRSTEFPEGSFLAHPVVPDAYRVRFIEEGENYHEEIASFEVKYLPPITLYFRFHHSYPSRKNPAFLISCDWLTLKQLESLCYHLEKLWYDGKNEVVLYMWMQFLQEDVLSYLGLQDGLMIRYFSDFPSKRLSSAQKSYQESSSLAGMQNGYNRQSSCSAVYRKNLGRCESQQAHSSTCDSRHTNHVRTKNADAYDDSLKTEGTRFFSFVTRGMGKYDRRALCIRYQRKQFLITRLKVHNERKIKESYENEWYTCNICMEAKQGKFFMQFSECQHMYCKDCMKSYFEVQINDGTVSSITCPEEKCSTPVLPSQIQELVGPELYARYDKLLLTAILDKMGDVMYCPRVFCQCPVVLEPDRSMAICPSCQFVFCIYCKMAYHGVASCRYKKEERKRIREEYLNSSKANKQLMEQRYGRRALEMLVEETLTEEWIESNSKKCPECRSAIEKFDGCNKVTCWRCGSFFCWLCMTRLRTANPYSHFSDPKSQCHNLLFQGVVEIEEEEDEDWEVGAFL